MHCAKVMAFILAFGVMLLTQAHADSGIPTSVDWHMEGDEIAVGYLDGAVEILDASTLDIIRTFHVPGSVNIVQWNPIDRRLAGVSGGVEIENTLLWILDTIDGELVEGLRGNFTVGDVDWNPSGDMLVTTDFIGMGSQNLVHLWRADLEQFSTVLALDNYLFRYVDWHPIDESLIAVAEEGGTVAIWDTETNELLSIANIVSVDELNSLQDIAYSPDGNRLVSITYMEDIEFWSWDGLQLVSLGTLPNDLSHFGASRIQWSFDGSKLAIQEGNQIRIVDAETMTELSATPFVPFLYSMAWSPDGTNIVYVGRGQSLQSNLIQTISLSG